MSGVYSCHAPCDCCDDSSLWLDGWSNNTWQWPHPTVMQLPVFSLFLLVPSDFSLVSPTFIVKQSGSDVSGSVIYWHIYVCGGVWGQISFLSASHAPEWSLWQLLAVLWSCTHYNMLDSLWKWWHGVRDFENVSKQQLRTETIYKAGDKALLLCFWGKGLPISWPVSGNLVLRLSPLRGGQSQNDSVSKLVGLRGCCLEWLLCISPPV